MEWLYVMDYSDATISKINVTDIEDDDIERILMLYGFNTNSCVYMYSDKDITEIKDITNEHLDNSTTVGVNI
jgi:hypothetical protein